MIKRITITECTLHFDEDGQNKRPCYRVKNLSKDMAIFSIRLPYYNDLRLNGFSHTFSSNDEDYHILQFTSHKDKTKKIHIRIDTRKYCYIYKEIDDTPWELKFVFYNVWTQDDEYRFKYTTIQDYKEIPKTKLQKLWRRIRGVYHNIRYEFTYGKIANFINKFKVK